MLKYLFITNFSIIIDVVEINYIYRNSSVFMALRKNTKQSFKVILLKRLCGYMNKCIQYLIEKCKYFICKIIANIYMQRKNVKAMQKIFTKC